MPGQSLHLAGTTAKLILGQLQLQQPSGSTSSHSQQLLLPECMPAQLSWLKPCERRTFMSEAGKYGLGGLVLAGGALAVRTAFSATPLGETLYTA